MSSQALDALRLLFCDRPDLLEVIQLRDLESQKWVSSLRETNELFASPVNLYVTGRTGSGKTSLGNCLLEKPIMLSTGRIDCTHRVGFFRLASNLCYFDLPGAGSSEKYENINRAALLMPQLEDEFSEPPTLPIEQFEIADFSHCSETTNPQLSSYKILDWQSAKIQQLMTPDIILYVIAPHMQFLRADRQYLGQLLKTQQQHCDRNKVIFALNLFKRNGISLPTPQNLEDTRKHITDLYQRFYQGEPPIIEFDALTGTGVNEITSLICQILPANKLGNIQTVLRGDLKNLVEQERSERYLRNLIAIASRLATYKVDQKAGEKDLIQVAASAICTYGITTFKNPKEAEEIQSDINSLIEELSQLVQSQRGEDIIVIENVIEKQELTREVPQMINEVVTDWIEVNEVRVKPVSGWKKFSNKVTGLFGVKFFDEKLINETVKKPIERTVTRLAGYTKEVIGTVDAVVDQVEKTVGKDYLKGGYPVIKLLLSLGLGSQNHCHHPNQPFEECREQAEIFLDQKLASVKNQIEKLSEEDDPNHTEAQLNELLETTLISED